MHIIESLYPRIIWDIWDCIYGSQDLPILCLPHFGMGTFNSLMDLEILGDCSTSMAETETAEEELVCYLHTAGCDMKQDPLLWWKKNVLLYPHTLPMMF